MSSNVISLDCPRCGAHLTAALTEGERWEHLCRVLGQLVVMTDDACPVDGCGAERPEEIEE